MGKFKVGDKVVPTENDAETVNRHWNRHFKSEYGDAPFYFVISSDGDSVDVSNVKEGPYIVSWLASRFELVPAWQPKVGDKVRYKQKDLGEGTVIEIVDGGYVKVDTHGMFKICTERLSDIEPIPTTPAAPVVAQAQPSALKIEAGRYYKTRDGRKVGPMERFDSDSLTDGSGKLWTDDGDRYFFDDRGGDTDLVALWEDVANDNAEPARFKVGDIVMDRESVDRDKAVVRAVDGNRFTIEWFDDGKPNGTTGSWPFDDFDLVEQPSTLSIVALIEDGQPKPATKPKVHADQASATAEASRLALEHPGQRFGVFVLADSKIAERYETTVLATRLVA